MTMFLYFVTYASFELLKWNCVLSSSVFKRAEDGCQLFNCTFDLFSEPPGKKARQTNNNSDTHS